MRFHRAAKLKPAKKRINDVVLALFATAFTLFPAVSISIWAYGQFHDPREVRALSVLTVEGEPKLFDEPLVSVTFDDGWRSVYDEAVPLLQKYNIRTTQYVLPAAVKDRNYLSAEQIKSLSDTGHEIASHGFDHIDFTALDDEKLGFQLSEPKSMLQNILGKKIEHFASPLGSRNARTLSAISKHYQSHRNTEADIQTEVGPEDFNLKGKFNRFDIIAYTIRNDTTDDQLRQALDFANRTNSWFIITYHQIDDSKSLYSVTAETLDRHLRIIHESEIKTPTIGDVIGAAFKE